MTETLEKRATTSNETKIACGGGLKSLILSINSLELQTEKLEWKSSVSLNPAVKVINAVFVEL